MPSFNPAMQKATLAELPDDPHGLISKRTAELDGVAVTQVTFHRGARWSNCTFVEFSRGNDYYA
ncbi:hypothetical protein [Pseudonocardia sp. N23]|uniref:hypothetical protein n=1 Tax=Pseudonocardia sp. N23 TaxID=1987376 RepID=UPI000BFD6365|nr:hypothetical protein [Pseudonocardia sp. N23]GAY07589.1 hypothetical protein TOK_3609 [Pseudonocardia sp. N23]